MTLVQRRNLIGVDEFLPAALLGVQAEFAAAQIERGFQPVAVENRDELTIIDCAVVPAGGQGDALAVRPKEFWHGSF